MIIIHGMNSDVNEAFERPWGSARQVVSEPTSPLIHFVEAPLSTASHFGEAGTGSATADTGVVRRKTDASVELQLVSAGAVMRGNWPRFRRCSVARGSGGRPISLLFWPAEIDQPMGVYSPASAASASATVIIKVSGSMGDATNP
jgi:hypothetical protein